VKRVALISDIRGNAVALEAVLADIERQRVDEIVCLGDVAVGAPQPREVLGRLRDLGCAVVMGNADEWLLEGLPNEPADEDSRRLAAIVAWARAQLDSPAREYLRSFAPRVELDLEGRSLLGFHSSPHSANERVLAETPQPELEPLLADFPAAIYAAGDTHLQLLRRLGDTLFINPAASGCRSTPPRPGSAMPRFADYALIEVESGGAGVALRRVAVDAREASRTALATDMSHRDEWAAILGRRIASRNATAITAAR
jgi:predicted phosphodiesterase